MINPESQNFLSKPEINFCSNCWRPKHGCVKLVTSTSNGSIQLQDKSIHIIDEHIIDFLVT